MEKENVSNATTPQDDGAGEKLVGEKNGHNSKGVEVKYISPSNGEAKIDIENLKSAFAGMGKEELMKFANDPFWVRTRWFLFILFWVLWVAMLAGAIAIIVLAPKCAPPTPKDWWEQSPIYKADVAKFSKDSKSGLQGDLKGFTTKLDYLSSLGVKTVVLSNILKVSDKNSDGIDEFKTIAPVFGSIQDLRALIAAAKEKGLKLLMTLVPNHSTLQNSLFNKSVHNEEPFSSYYVWADAKGTSLADGKPQTPNNWFSKEGGSAWEWSETRKQFYLHQFSQDEPEFNFRNEDVVKYFNDVIEFWLNQGVDGFFIERAAYLMEDQELRDEKFGREISSATHTDYAFYDHGRTANVPELAALLRNWTSLVSNSSGILIVDDVAVANDRSVAHLVVTQQTLKPYPQYSVEELRAVINNTLKANSWPTWQLKVQDEPEGSSLSQGVMLSTMLLPGTPVTVAGQELGLRDLNEIPWESTTDGMKSVSSQVANSHSIYSAYKTLVEARESPSILHGTLQLDVINSTSVLAYTRIKSGNPGYLVVFNAGSDENEEVDVRNLDRIPDELTLLLASDASTMANLTKVASSVVQLPPRSVAVFRFVPKEAT